MIKNAKDSNKRKMKNISKEANKEKRKRCFQGKGKKPFQLIILIFILLI